MNVLFSCSGRRNYLINYFKEVIGDKGLTIAVDSQSTASSFVDADISFQVPSVQEPGYIPMLLEIIKSHKVNILIPLNDWELPVIARNKGELEKYGAKVIVSDIEVIETFTDKWFTYNYFNSINIKNARNFY